MTKTTICHITTVHNRYDTRIFVKECTSVSQFGYEVYLIVADGEGDENIDGVKILDIGKPSSRIKRILGYHKKILRKALGLACDIYHFHDPELLRIVPTLKRKNKVVIYDSHEDVPRQLLDKAYIPTVFRKLLSRMVEAYEDRMVSKLSGVVTVTPSLEKRFLKNNSNVVQVRNFPKIQEFMENTDFSIDKDNAVCYVGAISKVRGILSMVDAMEHVRDTALLLGGKFEAEELRNLAKEREGWKNVVELGFLNRDEVKHTLNRSVAGLVVLEPTKSYLESIPVKMFEYMVAGIAVIASDFSYWRELIDDERCAMFVDPTNPKDISGAIMKLMQNKELAREMGSRGRKAVLEKFNWKNEEMRLIKLYQSLET